MGTTRKATVRKSRTTPEKVLARLDTSDPDSCWLWPGAVRPDGYGVVSVADKTRPVHRYLYEQLVGPVPDGLQLDHLCRVRHCCNPAHLEPVTGKENVLRGIGHSAENARKDVCQEGHPLTGDNVYVRPSGARNCRTCHREKNRVFMRAFYARKRATRTEEAS